MLEAERKRRDRRQEIRQRTASARQQGLLDPLLDFLRRERAGAAEAIRPTGPEWPYQRAFDDGKTYELDKILTWIENNSKTSPDGAVNTEE